MDAHGECAEPEQPPTGKLNRTAFKLFRRRKPGGAMPSIFGVRGGKGGGSEGATAGQGGLVRSKTHDGLAEAVLEGGRKEDPNGGSGEDPLSGGKEPSSSSSSSSGVGKSHSFFSLLRRNGRPTGSGERPRGRGGLKGLFSSMRWHRRDKGAKEDDGANQSHPNLMPGSLTASLECIQEEAPKPPAPVVAPVVAPPTSTCEDHMPPTPTAEVRPTVQEETDIVEPQVTHHGQPQGEIPNRIQDQVKDGQPGTTHDGEGHDTQQDSAITGCGDIIADQEDDAGSGGGGSGGGGSDKSTPGVSKPGASKKPSGVLAYQGGGEEMASPEQVRDTCVPEFWDILSQTEVKSQETLEGAESTEASKDGNCAQKVQDRSTTGKHIGLNQISAQHNHKEEQKSREKEQQEVIPSGDEGYWDSTTPGPEEDNTNSIQKEVIPRDSYSGDALYDLYTDPDENTAAVTSAEDIIPVPCCKPLSPITTTCPVKTHTTSLKDSKIPISIKHFTSPHSSHGPDSSNSHHIPHHQPTKSEVPRTKIPVSKVLVQRASYRSLAAGTTGKAATYHESAKK